MRNAAEKSSGFTIIELLVVMGIIGVVIGAVFGIYINTRTSAHTQEEVVEVQQGLRIAADQLARDIRLAGFMIPAGANPIAEANATGIRMRTSAPDGQMGRIAESFTTASTSVDAVLASRDMTDFFTAGDWVRIIRPPNKSEPLDDTFRVVSVQRDAREVTLSDFNATGVIYNPGDIIVRVDEENGTVPVTITYGMDGNELVREGEVLAENITGVAFSYVLTDGTETDAPASLGEIRSVRFTITGLSRDKGQGQKSRTVTQLATLRN
jgi:prepilin-type N-terminal cleavage/methylation domain-containing protein